MATVIDDNATLEVTGAQTANKSQLEHGVTYTVATYNIGFGASRDLLRRFLVLWQMSYLRCLPKRLANTSAGLNRTFPGLIASKRVTRRMPPKLPPKLPPKSGDLWRHLEWISYQRPLSKRDSDYLIRRASGPFTCDPLSMST